VEGEMQAYNPRENASALKLLVASEVRFLRDSLGEVLGRNRDVAVIGFAQDSRQIVTMSESLAPDIVLMDSALRDGIAAVRRLRETPAKPRTVVFAIAETAESILSWAEAGITGYISSDAALCDLNSLMIDIAAGKQTCAPRVSAALIRTVAASGTPAREQGIPSGTLTRRELEIVGLIGSGLSNKEIARRLNIGLATTKSHVHSVLTKLRLQRRGQAASWTRTLDR
jgi:DNA-binding NarL/FixJ family response regulator